MQNNSEMKHFIALFTLICSFSLTAQNRYSLIDTLNPKTGQIIQIHSLYFELEYSRKMYPTKEFNELIEIISKIPDGIFVLEYYTDCRGSKDYNRDLTQRRADSVINYIHKKNGQIQITGTGMGEDTLKNDCSCESKIFIKKTRFFEDTINNQPEFRPIIINNGGKDSVIDRQSHIKEIQSGSFYIGCSENEHYRNHRIVVRLTGFRRD